MRITPGQAAARVAAGLGRPPRDSLEAAVVLEAWGGLVPRSSLPLARGAMDRSADSSGGVTGRRAKGEITSVSTREILGLVATLLATTAWVAPLANALGSDTTARAWKIALPISIALQWFMRRRHLTGPDGLALIRRDTAVVAAMVLTGVIVPIALLFSPAMVLPAALVVTWVGGLLVVVRGWGIAYAAAIAAATSALQLGAPVLWDILLVVVMTNVAVYVAIVTSPASTGRPTPWRRSLAAAMIGGLLALLIVMDPSVEWASTKPFPVLVLVPSLLGSLWAGRHLNRIWTVLTGALAATSLAERPIRRNWRVFTSIIMGAFARLLLGTFLVSALAFWLLRDSASSEIGLIRLLLGLAAFGVVGFLAALLESFSRLVGASAVVIISLVAAVGALEGPTSFRGSSLLIAAVAAIVTGIIPIILLVRHPDRTLATLI